MHLLHPPAFAEVGKVELSFPFPTVGGGEIKEVNVSSLEGVKNLIVQMLKLLFSFGVILAVVSVALGGLQYMAAGASIGNVKNSESKIFNAVFGLVLLLGSFLILSTINPEILKGNFFTRKFEPLPNITPPGVEVEAGRERINTGRKENVQTPENINKAAEKELKKAGGDETKAIANAQAEIDRQNEVINTTQKEADVITNSLKTKIITTPGSAIDQAAIRLDDETIRLIQRESPGATIALDYKYGNGLYHTITYADGKSGLIKKGDLMRVESLIQARAQEAAQKRGLAQQTKANLESRKETPN